MFKTNHHFPRSLKESPSQQKVSCCIFDEVPGIVFTFNASMIEFYSQSWGMDEKHICKVCLMNLIISHDFFLLLNQRSENAYGFNLMVSK